MGKGTRFAIVGAGSVGQATAGHLVLRGLEVSGLYDRFPEYIEPVRERGGIEMIGPVLSGFAPISNATTDIGEAIDGADVVMVDVVADAHEWVAAQMAPYLKDGQIVVLHPGYPFGSIAFLHVLEAAGLRARIDIAETDSTYYAGHLAGPGKPGVRALKYTVLASALPASRTSHVLSVLEAAIPVLKPMANILEVGFHNTNPFLHVPAALLNWARIEQDTRRGDVEWTDWVTPTARRIGGLMDAEKIAVLTAMGLRAYNRNELSQMHYQGEQMPVVAPTGEFKEPMPTVPPRYITEDVPMALVPIAEMASKVRVPTPILDILIDMAGLVKETDFRREGRTLEKMGLADKRVEEILAIVNG